MPDPLLSFNFLTLWHIKSGGIVAAQLESCCAITMIVLCFVHALNHLLNIKLQYKKDNRKNYAEDQDDVIRFLCLKVSI